MQRGGTNERKFGLEVEGIVISFLSPITFIVICVPSLNGAEVRKVKMLRASVTSNEKAVLRS
jgi:hypothetical protein